MSSLSDLILRLTNIYKQEPDAAYRALDGVFFAFTDEASLEPDLLNLALKNSTAQARDTIGRKTTIKIAEMPLPAETAAVGLNAELVERLIADRKRLEELAAADGLTVEEYEQASTLEDILRVDLHVELVRDFVSRLDSAVELLESLDETDFRSVLSKTARHFLREAHINYLYGMESSACILFWAAIEHSLRELLSKKDVLFRNVSEGLDDAENTLGLSNDVRVAAEEIYTLRNNAVHNIEEFWNSDRNMRDHIPSNSRLVIATLYGLMEA